MLGSGIFNLLSDDHLKRLISVPYDFHHLTHTSPSHVQSLQRTRENDLVTEFSAIRASQKPVTSLKGIRADDLHFRNFSIDDLGTPTPTGVATSGDDEHAFAVPPPPAASPPASPGASSSVSPKQQVAQPQRESRVYENFSRPVSRYPRTGSGSSIVSSPPQRPTPQLADAPELESAPHAINDVVVGQPQQEQEQEPAPPRKVSLSQVNLAALFESENQGYGVDVDPRASTTNLALDLEDVPEEEEEKETGVTQWHNSPDQPADNRLEAAPAGLEQPSGLSMPQSHPSICVAEELSKKFSEVLASPTLPQYRVYQQQTPKQDVQTPVYDAIYDSWDADIDYCYEHAAESTSNFDWSRQSFDEPRHPATIAEESEQESWQQYHHQQLKKHQPSIHLSTSSLCCPELDPSPSRSVPSTQLAVTPSTMAFEGDYFQVPGSMFPAPEAKQVTQEPLYDDYAEPDRHLSFCSQGVIQAPLDHHSVSPRCSLSPVSNCNSQESLILSRAASIARKHRSSISATSIPELVNSLASSRETMPTVSSPSHHRQTKSLEAGQILFGSVEDSTASLDSAEVVSPMHDRAKSTSEVVAPLPARPGRKTSRTTSYSLFPGN